VACAWLGKWIVEAFIYASTLLYVVKESSFTMIAMDGGICARITIRGLIFFK
jgi:hypothetical protein